jgi:hypothetical protein
MQTTEPTSVEINDAFNQSMNAGMLAFLIEAYDLPSEVVADLVIKHDSLDKRNEITFMMLLGFYAVTYEGITPDDLANRADELSKSGLVERFLANAVMLTFQ